MGDAGIERLEVAAVSVGAKTYIAGGLVPDGATAAVEIYPDGTRAPDLPMPLHHAMAVNYEGEVVVIGGFIGPGFGKQSDRVFRLTDDGWEELPRLPRARAAGGAAVIGAQIVVVGGQAGGELLAQTDIFDGTRWRQGAPIPTRRDHLAVAAHDGFVYAIGGRRRNINAVVGTVERYDIAANRWSRIADLPTPRGGMAAVAVGDSIVVAGGEGPTDRAGSDGVYDEVEQLDTGSLTWQVLPRMRTARHGIGMVGDAGSDLGCGITLGSVTVFVGGRRAGLTVSRTVEQLSFPTHL